MFGHQNDSDNPSQFSGNDGGPSADDFLKRSDDSSAASDASGSSFQNTDASTDSTMPPMPTSDDNYSTPPADAGAADTQSESEHEELLPATTSQNDDDDSSLLSIKQQALGQLSPLVNHLDQSPEEKFHTIMMMIQASDNQSLIKSAYEAAQNIPDEKTRAQALLDVVNEINYFTQHPNA